MAIKFSDISIDPPKEPLTDAELLLVDDVEQYIDSKIVNTFKKDVTERIYIELCYVMLIFLFHH